MEMLKIAVIVLTVLFMSAMTMPTLFALTDPVPSSSSAAETDSARVVQGEVLKMDGDFYLVKNKNGEEVRLRVDKDTLLDIRTKIRMKIGDKVDATVMADGRTASIIKVQ